MSKICFLAFVLMGTTVWASKPVPAPEKKKYSPPVYSPLMPTHGADPMRSTQWYLDAVRAPQAWSLLPHTTAPVVVAVIDSGVEYQHPDLQANLAFNPLEWPMNGLDDDGNKLKDDFLGYNFADSRPEAWDDNGHGTLIAGIIASVHNNGVGGQGTCPVCKILPYRFLDENGYGDTSDAIQGIYYGAKRGVKVMNLSFGDEGKDKDLQKAIEYAGKMDVLVVIAAGNWEWNNDSHNVFPANFDYEHTITVGAINQKMELWEGSGWGKKHVHLGAPGEKISGPYIEDPWDEGNGTSLAAPIVAAIGGMVRAADPSLDAPTTKRILEATIQPLPALKGKFRHAGMVNAEAAVRCALDITHACLTK
ncbi:MAG: S8 family serine peptidase [Bdellovibrionaceae bacterium]|nr:S8 family serine peptidase [Pseudobdellovibrionaceae bacterium]